MVGLVNGWVNEWVGGWIDRGMNERINEYELFKFILKIPFLRKFF